MLTKKDIQAVREAIIVDDEQWPLMFNALADVGRFRIFKLLLKQPEVCVTDVANVLQISLPAASQQLRIMEHAGLVKKERMGQMMCYRLCNDDLLVKSIIKITKK
ncbi:MAG: metalloregulator ArsR/SmtB family transcription factor [Candidatus Andersenbacteria bacterium]